MDESESVGGVAPRRVPRWAVPVALAAAVPVVVVAALLAAGPAGDPQAAVLSRLVPRYLLTAGGSTDLATGQVPWFQVHAADSNRLVGSVPPPAPDPGAVQEIVVGPAGTFLVAASRGTPCESRLYRFRLTAAGMPTGLAAVPGGPVPALVGGLAMSPDGRRVAYTTAPCVAAGRPELPPLVGLPARAGLTVLDLATGRARSWTADRPLVVGEIVWAGDSRTLGFTTGEIGDRAPARPGDLPGTAAVGDVTVRALDADAPGADLLAGRVLFRQPAGDGRVQSAVMSPDGRTGSGTLQVGQPPTAELFTFAEGQPLRVTHTDPANTLVFVTYADRYACVGGVDVFGRLVEDRLAIPGQRGQECGAAYDFPR